MASIQTSSYQGRYLKLTVVEESYSIKNNTSTIRWTIESIGGSSTYYTIDSYKVVVGGVTRDGDGSTVSYNTHQFPAAKGSKTGTFTVNHNNDGTASNVTFELHGKVYNSGDESLTGSIALTTIPRASTVTCADGNIGSSTTINISRASSSFTHTLTYSFGSLSGTIATKTTETSKGWEIPTSFYAQIPNAQSGQGTITCQTYNGNTLIGTKTCTFKAFVVDSNPIISATIKDVNNTTKALTGNENKLVKYFSNAQVVISATPKHDDGSTIVSQKVTCGDGKTSNNATSTLENVESGTFTVSCTDSRGFSSGDVTIEKEMIDYIKLAITDLVVERENSTSSTINVRLQGQWFNDSFGSQTNALTLQWRYRMSGGTWSDYITITPTIIDNTFTYTGVLGTNYDYQQAFEFEFKVTDKLMNPTPSTVIVTKGTPIIDIGENDIKIDGDIYMNGNILLDYQVIETW